MPVDLRFSCFSLDMLVTFIAIFRGSLINVKSLLQQIDNNNNIHIQIFVRLCSKTKEENFSLQINYLMSWSDSKKTYNVES